MGQTLLLAFLPTLRRKALSARTVAAWRSDSSWFVVWNMNFIFPYIGNHNPNWFSYFSDGLKTTNQQYFFFFTRILLWYIVSITKEFGGISTWKILDPLSPGINKQRVSWLRYGLKVQVDADWSPWSWLVQPRWKDTFVYPITDNLENIINNMNAIYETVKLYSNYLIYKKIYIWNYRKAKIHWNITAAAATLAMKGGVWCWLHPHYHWYTPFTCISSEAPCSAVEAAFLF